MSVVEGASSDPHVSVLLPASLRLLLLRLVEGGILLTLLYALLPHILVVHVVHRFSLCRPLVDSSDRANLCGFLSLKFSAFRFSF